MFDDLSVHLTPPYENETTMSVQDKVVLELSLLPLQLLTFWDEHLSDILEIVGCEQSEKVAAGYRWQSGRAFANVMTVLSSPGTVLEEAVHLLDHNLGDEEKSFSEGGGLNAAIAQHGLRFKSFYDHSPDALEEYASQNPREHLAAAARYFCGGPNVRQVFEDVNKPLFEYMGKVWFNDETWKEALT